MFLITEYVDNRYFAANIFTIIIYSGMYEMIVFELYKDKWRKSVFTFLFLKISLNKYWFPSFVRESIFLRLNLSLFLVIYFYLFSRNLSIFLKLK